MFAAAMLALLVTLALALVRAILGPTVFDRVQAANTIGTVALLALAVLGFLTGRPDFLDLAITCGPGMKHLQEMLPAKMRGGHAVNSQAVVPLILKHAGPGDAVLVKGSLGSRMALVVEALQNAGEAPPRAANGN